MAVEEPQESPALAALTALGRDAPRPHTTAELERGLGVLRARIAAAQTSRHTWWRWTLVGAAVVCVVIAVQLIVVSRQDRANGVAVSRVEGGAILDGGYLSQSGRGGITLYFREGSTFALASGTRGRLRAVTRDGAHLALERGSASVRITRNPARRWVVEAGPFTVTVKGTRFTVSWDPGSERFELRLQDGRVAVSGPSVGEALALRAGQRLVVSLPRAETVITEEPTARGVQQSDGAAMPGGAGAASPGAGSQGAGAPGAASRGRGQSPGASEGPEAAAGVSTRRSPATAVRGLSVAAAAPTQATSGATPASPARGVPVRPRRWAADLARGRWDDILADVDAAGADVTLETASSEELFAVADAARYRRRAELARAALLAQRRRFPNAPRAADTSFLLGRVEELHVGGAERALAWYDEYLNQAPSGAYAAEALGRKMTLTSDMRGADAARPLADLYLRRFPRGSYAAAARALQRVP